MGLFRKGKTCIIAKFHRTDSFIFVVILGGGGTPSYSQRNMVPVSNQGRIVQQKEEWALPFTCCAQDKEGHLPSLPLWLLAYGKPFLLPFYGIIYFVIFSA